MHILIPLSYNDSCFTKAAWTPLRFRTTMNDIKVYQWVCYRAKYNAKGFIYLLTSYLLTYSIVQGII